MNSKGSLQKYENNDLSIKDLILSRWTDLLELNFLILLCCIPVLTIPIGIICANRVLNNFIYKRTGFVWDDFKEEFRESFKDGLILGLISLPMECMILVLVTFIKPLSVSSLGKHNRQPFRQKRPSDHSLIWSDGQSH